MNVKWLFLMAYRDARHNFTRLGLFVASIILGIASLVAIYSFGDNLEHDIDLQAATLLGADLAVSGNKAPSQVVSREITIPGTKRSQERDFASMLTFKKSQASRLVQIKALEGDFPYYGTLETTPVSAGASFRGHREALVDRTLMTQYKARVGDSIKVGEQSFAIAGILNNAPGQSGFSSTIAPIVYIPLAYLTSTKLVQVGSRIRYVYFYKFNQTGPGLGRRLKRLLDRFDKVLDKEGFHTETVQTKKENTGRAFGDLTRFLSLIGFIALLLGSIGVASAVHIYVREKISAIAVLRCLGVSSIQAFLIFLIQIVGIGFLGSLAGTLLGIMVQQFFPILFKDLLPLQITSNLSWPAIGQGLVLGVIISLLFAMLPLVSIRNISPLNTLRLSLEATNRREPLQWVVYGAIFGFIAVFARFQLGSVEQTVYFMLGLVAAFLILAATAYSLMSFIRELIKQSWSYLLRQGFSNLYRPNNQTIILVISIGLGTAFICTLIFIQGLLLRRIDMSSGPGRPNLILFDIQNNQKYKLADLTKRFGLPILQQEPVVTMTIEQVNGQTANQIRKSGARRLASVEPLMHEIRATYRDSLISSEKLSAGVFEARLKAHSDTPRISMAEDYALRNHFKIGDRLLFNVQGLPLATVVGSLRSIDWNGFQTNFLLVFPTGVLEEAPQFQVLLTRARNINESSNYQREVLKEFPNVSLIDLHLVLGVLNNIFAKIAFVIRFMSGFSILTGLVVLISSVRMSKYQRIQESVLLRTLGASRNQILIITGLEYLFLGLLASLTGVLLALAASWTLAKYSFKAEFVPELLPALLLALAVALLTVIIGLLGSRGILNKPPLETLRKDV